MQDNVFLWVDGVLVDDENLEHPASDASYAFGKDMLVYNDSVYICGYYFDTTLNRYRAFVWNDGTITALSTSKSYAYDIDQYEGSIYVAGKIEFSGENRAVYWVDGSATYLPRDTGEINAAAAIAKNETNLSIIGSSNSGSNIPVYWLDGTMHTISGRKLLDVQYSSDGTQHIVGNKDSYNVIAAYWIDGVEQTLDLPNEDTYDSEAIRIWVR